MGLSKIILVALLAWGLSPRALSGWGYEAHKRVNGYAVDITGGVLGEFLQAHREELVALSIDADERKADDPSEGHKHFIDLEYYGTPPAGSIPYDRAEAEARFTAENMVSWGTLPWVLTEVTWALRDAMAVGDWDRVVPLAADLGHYLADGHQPLHTTVNYDGQDTDNRGVHHMFETNMVNRYLDHLTPPIGPWPVIGDLQEDIFAWLIESYKDVNMVIHADIWARSELSPEAQNNIARGYRADEAAIPAAYLERLYAQTGVIAWQRISAASARLSALWQWAWLEAGRPPPPGP